MNWIQLLSLPLAIVIGFILGFGVKTTVQLGKAEANALLFTTTEDGRFWWYDGIRLPASPLTDRLQDAYSQRKHGAYVGIPWGTMICSRKPNHSGPCNGLANKACSEASRKGCYG